MKYGDCSRPIVVSTGNKNKLRELHSVAERYGLTLLSPAEICQKKGLSPFQDVEESGLTFQENALLKARACMEWCGEISLGDDSGLEVEALENRPGIYSARYAGPGATDSQKIQKLLSELTAKEKIDQNLSRRAQFHCSLALVFPNNETLEAEGILTGIVLREPRGNMGFGYDPIIEIDALGQTLAEVDFAVTCRQGFRAIAAEKLFQNLSQLRENQK